MTHAKTRTQWALAIGAVVFAGALLIQILMSAFRSPKDDFDDYLSRIARVQNQPISQWTFDEFTTPSRRDLFTPIERLTIGLIESTQLRKCELLELVYLHNDALGKVQDEFRNLDYQVNVLHGLRRCIDDGELSLELTEKLRAILGQKWNQLPSHLNNTLLYSTASHKQLFSHEWIQPESAASPQLYRDFAQLLSALLNGYQRQDLPINFSATPYQESIEKQRTIGQLYFSLFQTNQWLERINHQLYTFDSSVTCRAQMDNTQLKTMLNVFSAMYVDRIQPYLATLSQHYGSVSPLLEIYNSPTVATRYVHPIEAEYELFKKNIRLHVDYWSNLRERCNLSMDQLVGRE